MITVPYESDIIFTPFIQEVSFEYDNPDSLSFTFGNKFNLGTSEYTLGKILSDTTSSAQRSQRSLSGGLISDVSSYQSGNTIDSINNTISGNTAEVRKDLDAVSDALKRQTDDLKEVNGRLDSYIKRYNIDMDNVTENFDLVKDTFKNYSTTSEVDKKLDDTKQSALDQAANNAQAKIDRTTRMLLRNG